jgi:hypothetical protein
MYKYDNINDRLGDRKVFIGTRTIKRGEAILE